MNGSANKWNLIPKELVSLCDGDYWLPASSSKIYATVTDFYLNGFWNDYKRVFGAGKQALNMYLEYDDFEEDDYVEIWVAVYKVGISNPIWIDTIKLDTFFGNLEINAEMVLNTGLYFIVISHVKLEDNRIQQYEHLANNASQLSCGVRYNFIVEPDGNNLIHPEIQEIKFTPRPLSEWKEKVKKSNIESTTMDAQLILKKPFDLANNYLQIEVFDESLNWIAWSDYATDNGYISVLGFYPILNGEYLFVVLHNQTPIFYSKITCRDGLCTVKRLEKWSNDNTLADVLASRSHANELIFQPTTYGRCLQLLENIQIWEQDDSYLNSDNLDKLLKDQ